MRPCCEQHPSLSPAKHSPFVRLPREPYCDAASTCGCCKLSSNKKGIHPVDIYRHWDEMDSVADRAHRDLPWDFVQQFLESHDYHLRDKVPGSSADRAYCVARAIDSDDNPIFIKSVPAADPQNEELHISELLSTEHSALDPRNHAAPLRNVLYYHPDFSSFPRYNRESAPTDSRAFLITDELEPLPRNLVNDFVPATVGDCLEFARQCLEGLAFFHDLGIAHGDISQWNILMSESYGEPPRYYIIDFGLSRHIPKPWPCEPRFLPLKPRVTHESPEWSTSTPFNPFKHDVYCMSVSWRFKIDRWDENKYWGRIPAFTNLIASMEHPNPLERPTASAALRTLENIIDTLPHEISRLSFTDRWNYRTHRRAPTPPLSLASSSSDESDSGSEDIEDILPTPPSSQLPTKSSAKHDPFRLSMLKAALPV